MEFSERYKKCFKPWRLEEPIEQQISRMEGDIKLISEKIDGIDALKKQFRGSSFEAELTNVQTILIQMLSDIRLCMAEAVAIREQGGARES